MKLLLVALLSVISYHFCNGYPVVEGELSEDLLLENATSLEYWFDESNETASNGSSPLYMHGFKKKVVDKVKEGIKTVKEKVKGGFDKVKDKIKDFRDKIGSKGGGSGGGSGGGYYRDKYDRDYDRDKYNRDKYNRDHDRDKYNRDYDRDRDSNYGGGGGFSDPNAKWICLVIGIFMIVGILGGIIYFLRKVEKD